MNKPQRLSKSRFIAGYQCRLRLWYELHASFEPDEASDSKLAVFTTGQEVGELACERHPGGRLISHDHLHFNDALTETNELLKDESIPALFEAAFEYEGLIARADIVERLPDGGWRLIEVKSTTKVKEIHLLDFAFQLLVLRNAGLDVREGGVLTLNKSYVYDGVKLDINALFQLHDVFDYAKEVADSLLRLIKEMQSVIVSNEPPDIEPGDHCFEPYMCPFYGHCTRDVRFPEHGLSELPRLLTERHEELLDANIEEIRDIPVDFPFSEKQQIVRTAIIEERDIVNQKELPKVDAIKRPIRHLDFETFSPAIPRFAGTRPYDAIPFLFSVHIERKGSEPGHKEYLHERNDDPRPQLAKRLIQALGRRGAVCTFSHYERRVLRELRDAVPDYASELRSIEDRLVDLLTLVRRAYYHPDFRGSFSLKDVFPVLCPEQGYEDLEIADGQIAAVRYVKALETDDIAQRNFVFEQLREYCKRDTLATLKVRQALVRMIQ